MREGSGEFAAVFAIAVDELHVFVFGETVADHHPEAGLQVAGLLDDAVDVADDLIARGIVGGVG